MWYPYPRLGYPGTGALFFKSTIKIGFAVFKKHRNKSRERFLVLKYYFSCYHFTKTPAHKHITEQPFTARCA